MKKTNTSNTITTLKYRVMQSFKLPEAITLTNGKIIESGVRIGPGEDLILESLSKVALQKLLESGFIKEVNADGSIKTNKDEGIVFTKIFLEGLCSPSRVDQLSKLLTEKRFSTKELRIIKDKIELVISSGISAPILLLLQDQVISQLYDLEILNES